MPGSGRASSRIVWAAAAATTASSLLAGRIERFAAGYFDEGIYRMLVANLLEDGYFGYGPGDRIALRPPGYPLFMAGIRWLVDSQWVVRGVQAVLAGATVLLAAWIARRLFGAAAAAATAVLLAITGVLAAYASFELSECLATFLLVAAAAATLKAAQSSSARWAATAGVALGASTLTRPQSLPLVAVLAVWLFVAAGDRARRASLSLILAGAAVATVAPWTIRNAVRLHAFVPVSTYGGVNFWLANNPRANGRFPGSSSAFLSAEEFARIDALGEVEEEREWYRLAFQFIREHPVRTLGNWARDVAVYAGARDMYPRDRLILRGRWRPPLLDDRVLWPLGLGGFVLALRRRDATALLPGVVVASFVAFFMVFLPLARYRHGLHPFLAVSAGAMLVWCAQAVRRRAPLRR